MTLLDRVIGRKTFSHGVHPPEHKEKTVELPIQRMPIPHSLVIPMSQHIGAPAKPIVKPRQEIKRGEPIAEPGGFVSVPMHSPATGAVKRIGLERDAKGNMSQAIVIEPNPEASLDIEFGEHVDITSLSKEDLIKAVQSTGIVGMGGAAFPTHVKMAVPDGKVIHTVMVNGCECEPYLTTDYRVMLEQPESIFKGLDIVMRILGAKQGYIGIEDNKPDAIQVMKRHEKPTMQVGVCHTKYPQGAEKMLIKSLLNLEVPAGGLPLDIGVAVFNVGTLASIGELLPLGRGLIERVVTVTGPGVTRPGNYIIALGTPLRFILEYCGYRGDDNTEVILGGPMMGAAAPSLDVPTTKGVTGILVLTQKELAFSDSARILPCIKCGSCLMACPMNLNPSYLGLLARKGRYEEMSNDYHLMDCFECGSCAYTCPSNIPLVQYFRIAKSVIREKQAAANKQE